MMPVRSHAVRRNTLLLFVSPLLANDTAGTITAVRELHAPGRRPNLFIPVRSTRHRAALGTCQYRSRSRSSSASAGGWLCLGGIVAKHHPGSYCGDEDWTTRVMLEPILAQEKSTLKTCMTCSSATRVDRCSRSRSIDAVSHLTSTMIPEGGTAWTPMRLKRLRSVRTGEEWV
jgi:hypothetical protein